MERGEQGRGGKLGKGGGTGDGRRNRAEVGKQGGAGCQIQREVI